MPRLTMITEMTVRVNNELGDEIGSFMVDRGVAIASKSRNAEEIIDSVVRELSEEISESTKAMFASENRNTN